MVTRPLSRRERRELAAAGFRFTKRRASFADFEANLLGLAVTLLRDWGASAAQLRVILAVPNARALARALTGESLTTTATRDRVCCVIGLYGRLVYWDGDRLEVKPLPKMQQGSRRHPALAVLARGRLSDLLRLWLRLERREERARATAAKTRRRKRRARPTARAREVQ